MFNYGGLQRPNRHETENTKNIATENESYFTLGEHQQINK